MVGGRNYHRSQFNLATQGERQPGSSFKPFVLAAALQSGISPATTFVSKPVTIDTGGRLWSVNNYEGDYIGTIDLTQRDRVLGQLGLRAADEHRRPGERRARRRKALGITTPAQRRTSRSGSAPSRRPRSRWRARTRPSRTAATASTARSSATSPASSTALAGRQRATCEKDNASCPHRVLDGRTPRSSTSSSRASCSYGTGKAAQLSGGCRSPARPARPRTTATPGSSATRRDLVTAVWVGYPDELRPMLTEYHGDRSPAARIRR